MTLHDSMTKDPCSPWHIGSPLYMPANRRDILDCANGEKNPLLRSMIFCTEDAVSRSDVDSCIRHLSMCLQGFKDSPKRFRFIRARNPDILARLLDLPGIEKINGFVLPKYDVNVHQAYFDRLQGSHFKVLPTLETKDVFDQQAMIELRQALLQDDVFSRVFMLRIGGNDLMNLLGIRRSRSLTLYETPLGSVISQLVTTFKPYGFSMSAPVFEYLDDTATLQKEIQLDLAYGLTGKTAIHPAQVPFIESCYKVDSEDYDMALSIIDHKSPAVFKMHNAMCEVATHQGWAENIINRFICYGIQDTDLLKGYAELSI